MTIEQVKAQLPEVRVKWMGKFWQARVSGRLNKFASVSPYKRLGQRGRIETIMGPVFHYAWETVQRAVNNETPLLT